MGCSTQHDKCWCKVVADDWKPHVDARRKCDLGRALLLGSRWNKWGKKKTGSTSVLKPENHRVQCFIVETHKCPIPMNSIVQFECKENKLNDVDGEEHFELKYFMLFKKINIRYLKRFFVSYAPDCNNHCHKRLNKKRWKYKQPGKLHLIFPRVIMLQLHVDQYLK